MKKIQIFVACHKPTEVISNDIYTPIHVGRAVSKYKAEMAEMLGDNTGDNISEKNPYFCELTALYWAWKNCHDADYIGLAHYRRYFDCEGKDFEKLFESGVDVVMAGPRFRHYNRWNFLKSFVGIEDLTIMQMVLQKMYPDYYATMVSYANDYLDYPFNMLVCRRELFGEYAKWIFSILFECEKYVKPSPYSRARRLYGYLSEFLMPVYFMHNGLRIEGMPYFYNDTGDHIVDYNWRQRIIRKVLKKIYFRYLNAPLEIDNSVKAALLADGVEVF